jgi:hypothetical protein
VKWLKGNIRISIPGSRLVVISTFAELSVEKWKSQIVVMSGMTLVSEGENGYESAPKDV